MVEAINRIKNAEEKAFEIIQKANSNAISIALNANKAAYEKYESTIQNEKEHLKVKLSEKLKEVENNLSVEIEEAKHKGEALKENAASKSFEVIEKILEDFIK